METTIMQSRLRMEFVVDYDEELNEQIIEAKNYNNIRPLATDQQVLDAAQLISSLQKYVLSNIERRDDTQLASIMD